MSTLDKKYYHNIDLDSNELKAGRIYNLITTQRTGLSLTTTDKGYIVYDTDLLSLYVWNGTAWTTAAGGSGTVTSVSAGTGMSFTAITGAGSVSINTAKVPYLASGFSTGLLKYDGSAWVFDNSAYLTGITSGQVTTALGYTPVTNARTLTINSTAFDLTANRTWNVGDLLSSGSYSNPTWITTLAYSKLTGAPTIPTVGTWGVLNYPTWVSGTPFVKMTAAGTFGLDTATYLTSAVTSVGMTVPSAFSVTPSTITTSGTFAVTGAGTTAQYVRGDGTLATYNPGTGGGGASVSYYLNGSVTQGTFGGVAFKQMSKNAIFGTGTDFTINADGYIQSFITDSGNPNQLLIPTGNWNFEMWFSANSAGGSPSFYVELYKWDGTALTSITSSSATPENITGGTSTDLYTTALSVPTTTLALTDRLAIRVYVVHSGRTIKLHTENSHLCQVITTFTTGLTALNGLTDQVQYFATPGNTGTSPNWSSVSPNHTLNIPLASAASVTAGLISKTDYDTFTGKQATITGAATTITSSNLTVSKALVSNTSGKVDVSATTNTELGYVSGVTSAIQIQLDSKVSSITFGSTGLSPSSPSSGVITVTGVLNATSGGTGLSSYAIGDIPYASTTTVLSKLAAVASGSYLRSAGTSTAPVWSTTTIPNTAVLGDIWYGSASNVITALTGNTTSTKKFLRQTGTGTVSAAPAWDTIAASDISGSALTIGSSDTNITLATGGTASTALLNAASISVAWTGQLAVGRGGTGASTLTGVVIGAGTAAMTAVSSVSANQLFRVNGTGTNYEFFTPSYLTSVTPHNLLSATHGDTLTDTVVRGDIIIGNSTPKWSRLPFPATAPSGKILQAGPTDVAWSTNPITIGASASVSGTNTGDQTITLSGDVTGSGTGSFSATIANGVVSLAKMDKIAANSIIGNNTGALGFPTALTGTNVTAMLDVFNGTYKGLVPAATSGTLPYLFLAADGTWLKVDPSAISPIATDTIVANTTGLSASPTAIAISDLTPKLTNLVGDSGSGGTKGLVPAPAVGDAAAGKFLKADGLWAVPTTTIGTNVVTNAMLAQVATATFKGRTTPSTGNVEDLTVTQATAMLNLFSTAATTQGLVPGSNGVGSTYFLRADGTWAVPAGGGGGGGTTTNPLIIKADSGTTEGTDLYTFDGATAKTINIVAGTNITITKTAGTLTISSTGGSSSAVSSDHPVTLMTAFLNYT